MNVERFFIIFNVYFFCSRLSGGVDDGIDAAAPGRHTPQTQSGALVVLFIEPIHYRVLQSFFLFIFSGFQSLVSH